MSRPVYTIAHKVQTQKAMKNHCRDKSKAKAFVSTFIQDSELSNKGRKDKKKKHYKDKHDSTNPATGVNTADVSDKKKKKKDVNEIMCYNYNKRRNYATKCPEPWKLKN